MTGRGDVWDHQLGGVRLLASMCATCIFRPGNPMHLAPGRLRAMTAAARAQQGYIICHDTLPRGAHPDAGQALCRGFHDLPDPTTFIQIMGRLDAFREVPPPGEAQP